MASEASAVSNRAAVTPTLPSARHFPTVSYPTTMADIPSRKTLTAAVTKTPSDRTIHPPSLAFVCHVGLIFPLLIRATSFADIVVAEQSLHTCWYNVFAFVGCRAGRMMCKDMKTCYGVEDMCDGRPHCQVSFTSHLRY